MTVYSRNLFDMILVDTLTQDSQVTINEFNIGLSDTAIFCLTVFFIFVIIIFLNKNKRDNVVEACSKLLSILPLTALANSIWKSQKLPKTTDPSNQSSQPRKAG